MESLAALIKNEDHENILNLQGDKFNKYKVIAAISLEKFSEALAFAEKNSFEHAYILYKLKNFKKALKILRKLKSKKCTILTSQCLYNLGYYEDAYTELASVGRDNEFGVNLSAMAALSHLNTKNRFKASIFATKYNTELKETVKSKINDSECQIEYEFNNLFKFIENEDLYLEKLGKLADKYNIPNSCVLKQIKILNRQNLENPTKKEQEICDFNDGKITTLTHPAHFQINFDNSHKSEYSTFIELSEHNYNPSDLLSLDQKSDKLKILEVYKYYKSGPDHNGKLNMCKRLRSCGYCIERDILQLIMSGCGMDEFRNEAFKLIKESKNI